MITIIILPTHKDNLDDYSGPSIITIIMKTTTTTTTTTTENATTTTVTTTTTTTDPQPTKMNNETKYLISLGVKPRVVEVLPGLFFGNLLSHRSDDLLRANHIGAIVHIGGYTSSWETLPRINSIPNDCILEIPCLSCIQLGMWVNLLEHLTSICDFIDRLAPPVLRSLTKLPKSEKRRKHWKEGGLSNANGNDKNRTDDDDDDDDDKNNNNSITGPGAILVTCFLGIHHSPTIIVAYLMRKFQESAERVMKFLHSMMSINIYPIPVPLGQVDVYFSFLYLRQITIWERVKYRVWQDDDNANPKRAYRHLLDDYGKYFTLVSEARELCYDLKETAEDDEEWKMKNDEVRSELVRVRNSVSARFRRFQTRKLACFNG